MKNQTIFIPRHCRAILYKELKGDRGGLQYVEAPRLRHDFYVGSYASVGSLFTRTFGNDYWQTSNIMKITKIKENVNADGDAHIFFQTMNTPYVLEVKPSNIQFREDLEPLVKETQRDIDSKEWLKLCNEFRKVADNEYNERRAEQDRKQIEEYEKRKAKAESNEKSTGGTVVREET